MEATKNYGDEPIRKDLGMLLLLAAVCPFGLLIWVGLFLAVQWFVLAAWAAAVGMAA